MLKEKKRRNKHIGAHLTCGCQSSESKHIKGKLGPFVIEIFAYSCPVSPSPPCQLGPSLSHDVLLLTSLMNRLNPYCNFSKAPIAFVEQRGDPDPKCFQKLKILPKCVCPKT